MKTKRVRPILVEIKDASNIFENNDKTLSFYEHKQHASSGGKKFELILISLEDEKIEANIDDCINIGGNIKDSFIFKPSLEILDNPYIKKVIARQSQISPELIQQLIDEYNNGEMKDFEIEMMYKECPNSSIKNWNYFPEPLLTNGFVTVVKQILYTEEEVLNLLDKLLNIDCSFTKEDGSQCIIQKGLPYTLQEWFNQNKKK